MPSMVALRTLSARTFTLCILCLVLLQGLPTRVLAQATQLAPGQQCFTAATSTSGGTVGVLTTLGTPTGGSGYTSGSYSNVPLTGGSGVGAFGNITVTAGAVSAIAIASAGSHYAVGDVLSASNANLGGAGSGFNVTVTAITGTGTGMLGALGTITGGTGGTAGTYAGVALTGGTGSGATANIIVSGGAVTAVAVLNPGIGYSVGDTLSAVAGTIGGTTGFSIPVNSVSVNFNVAGGSVAYYIPSTNTFKQTWQNAGQTILNQNPVPLDANGCAIVYGTGTYRQVLQDSLGNIIWDQLTTAAGTANNPFWAGTAGGTANAITITDPSFAAVDGSIINFVPIANNTGATTLNPSNYFGGSPPSIVKDTSAGPVALTGGEILATSGGAPNIISVIWSATQNDFHLLNAVIPSPSGTTTPLCGAVGLKITNNAGTPNSIITITAGQIVTQTASGLIVNRSNVTININLTTGTTTSTANGMDGEAVGTSRWLDVWAIDNGSGIGGLASVANGNGLNPTMPSGYSYKCRLGAMTVGGSGNLQRTIQFGPIGQYQIVTSSNTTTQCHVANGSAGTYSDTSPTLVSIFVASDGYCAPPSAVAVEVIGASGYQNGTTAEVLIAPSVAWGGANNGPFGSNGVIYPIFNRSVNISTSAWMIIESNFSIAWASSNVGGSVDLLQWRDNVNAN